MSLNYEKKGIKDRGKPQVYHLDSAYDEPEFAKIFLDLRTNIADLNKSFITKCVTGTEADFLLLMERAGDYLDKNYPDIEDVVREIVLQMFSDAIFGYYVLTPLIKDPKVSDFKILSWDHITCKVNGKRYVSDFKFFGETDYLEWYSRLISIFRGREGEENALQHYTDRRGTDEFFLRIDMELRNITSSGHPNLHVRKIPKSKYSWEYLKQAGMLNDEMIEYIADRVTNGYGFLISGRGGSGKSTLLNNMLDIIPYDESTLVVQESDELDSKHPQMQFEHTLEVQTRNGVKEFSLEDELRLGLLQDIDNMIVGEIKGEEAASVLITAMSTGARFFGTIHSNTAATSVRRLAQCAKFGCDYPLESLEEMATMIPLVLIHMSHFSIDEILEVKGWDDSKNQIVYHTVYNTEAEFFERK